MMQCEVCGDPVDTETDFNQYDSRAPVYADDYVFHLGCEDGIFGETYAQVDHD